MEKSRRMLDSVSFELDYLMTVPSTAKVSKWFGEASRELWADSSHRTSEQDELLERLLIDCAGEIEALKTAHGQIRKDDGFYPTRPIGVALDRIRDAIADFHLEAYGRVIELPKFSGIVDEWY